MFLTGKAIEEVEKLERVSKLMGIKTLNMDEDEQVVLFKLNKMFEVDLIFRLVIEGFMDTYMKAEGKGRKSVIDLVAKLMKIDEEV